MHKHNIAVYSNSFSHLTSSLLISSPSPVSSSSVVTEKNRLCTQSKSNIIHTRSHHRLRSSVPSQVIHVIYRISTKVSYHQRPREMALDRDSVHLSEGFQAPVTSFSFKSHSPCCNICRTSFPSAVKSG